jgi:hypothetical protein
VTIFTEIPRRRSALSEFTAPLSDVLGAVASETLTFSPLSSVTRQGELVKAQEGQPKGFLGIGGRYEPETPMLRPDEARQRVKDAGVELEIPEEGIRGGALDLMIGRKKEEMQRQDIIARGPGGVAAGAARIATTFGASMLDPLNIASAFIPFVGEARYARMLAAASGPLGRAGVRAGVGAVEGTLGAALVEPVIYYAATQEQADYDLSDSLQNIGYGTIFGGGLHVGVGAIGEAISRGQTWRQARPQPGEAVPQMLDALDMPAREAALRTGVAQALDGRQIDIGHLLPEDPLRDGIAPGIPQVREPSAASFTTADGSTWQVLPDGTTVRANEPAGLPVSGASAAQPVRTVYVSPEEAARLADLPPGARVIDRGDGTISISTGQAGRPRIVAVAMEPQVGSLPVHLRGGETVDGSPAYASVAVGAPRNSGEFLEVTSVKPHRGASQPRTARPSPQGLQDAAARSNAPEGLRMAAPEAVRTADQTLKAEAADETPNLGAAEAEEDAQRVAFALGVPEIVAREMAPFDELADTAAAYGRAVEAAALCQLRRGT